MPMYLDPAGTGRLKPSLRQAPYLLGSKLPSPAEFSSTTMLAVVPTMMVNPIEPGVATEAGRPGTGLSPSALPTSSVQFLSKTLFNPDNDLYINAGTSDGVGKWFTGQRAAHGQRRTGTNGKFLVGDVTAAVNTAGARHVLIQAMEFSPNSTFTGGSLLVLSNRGDSYVEGFCHESRFAGTMDGIEVATKGLTAAERWNHTLAFAWTSGTKGTHDGATASMSSFGTPISTIARSGGVATLTVPTGELNGITSVSTYPIIWISGMADASFNGFFPATATSGQTVTFTCPGPDTTTPVTTTLDSYGKAQGIAGKCQITQIVKTGNSAVVTVAAAHGTTGLGTLQLIGNGGASHLDQTSGWNRQWAVTAVGSNTYAINTTGSSIADGTYTYSGAGGGICFTIGAIAGNQSGTHGDQFHQGIDANNNYPQAALTDVTTGNTRFATTRFDGTSVSSNFRGYVASVSGLPAASSGQIYCLSAVDGSNAKGDGFVYVGSGSGTVGPSNNWNPIGGPILQTFTNIFGENYVYSTASPAYGDSSYINTFYADMVVAVRMTYDAAIVGERPYGAGAANIDWSRMWMDREWSDMPHDASKQALYLQDSDGVSQYRSVNGRLNGVFLSTKIVGADPLLEIFPTAGAMLNGNPIGLLAATDRQTGWFPLASNVKGQVQVGIPTGEAWWSNRPTYDNTGARYVPKGYFGQKPVVPISDILINPSYFSPGSVFGSGTTVGSALGVIDVLPLQPGYICDVTFNGISSDLAARISLVGRQIQRGQGMAFQPGEAVAIPLLCTISRSADWKSVSPAITFTKTVNIIVPNTGTFPSSTQRIDAASLPVALTLSNDSMTATQSGSGSNMARGTKVLSGKKYWELQVIQCTTSGTRGRIGICSSLKTLAGGSGGDADSVSFQTNNATVGGDGVTQTAPSSGNFGPGTRIGFCFDDTLSGGTVGKVWYSVGGIFRNGDPVAGTGGTSFDRTKSWYADLEFKAATDAFTLLLDANYHSFAPPTGYNIVT